VEIVYPRVAAIDVHKKQITVAVHTPGEKVGERRRQVRKYPTFYRALQEMTAWLVAQQVTHVTMESTGVYWKPVFHALAEAGGLEILLVNAHHVKNVPGRKTDLLTELTDRSFERGVRRPAVLARFRSRDQRRGRAAGVVRAGGADARFA